MPYPRDFDVETPREARKFFPERFEDDEEDDAEETEDADE